MANTTEAIIDDTEFSLNFTEIQEDYVKNVARNIQRDAPKNTGNYARDIGVTKIDNKTLVTHNKGKSYRLGHILEFGTKTQQAQPHYRPNHNPNEYAEVMRAVEIE